MKKQTSKPDASLAERFMITMYRLHHHKGTIKVPHHIDTGMFRVQIDTSIYMYTGASLLYPPCLPGES